MQRGVRGPENYSSSRTSGSADIRVNLPLGKTLSISLLVIATAGSLPASSLIRCMTVWASMRAWRRSAGVEFTTGGFLGISLSACICVDLPKMAVGICPPFILSATQLAIINLHLQVVCIVFQYKV